MDTIADFEDLLELFARHDVRYLIVGGLAFVFHAKPRFTKDLDLWLDPAIANTEKANRGLRDFGSPDLLTAHDPDEILQIGAAPNRIDLLRAIVTEPFEEAWSRRIVAPYGRVEANWIDLDGLIAIKSRIDHPRHREDVRVLRVVRRLLDDES